MKRYHQGNYTVRKLMPQEWQAYRDIRLEAARHEPNIFVRTLEEDAQRSDDEWRAILENKDRAYFALVHDDEIVGMTAIARHGDDPSIGVLAVSYIRDEHRNKGLSNLFYNARIDWALQKRLHALIVSHRHDNVASKAAIKRFYFEPTHVETAKWPDGSIEEQMFYRLDLQKWKDVFENS